MVKRLRRNPLKVESRVRFSLGSPILNEQLVERRVFLLLMQPLVVKLQIVGWLNLIIFFHNILARFVSSSILEDTKTNSNLLL